MSEIKYRAWDTIHQKMSNSFTLLDCINGNQVFALPENFVFVRYTGLKDKNGREIYEGDILEHAWKPIGKTEPKIRRFKVVFDEGAFKQWEPGDAEDAFDVWYYWNEVEVIGNIYETPELLK